METVSFRPVQELFIFKISIAGSMSFFFSFFFSFIILYFHFSLIPYSNVHSSKCLYSVKIQFSSIILIKTEVSFWKHFYFSNYLYWLEDETEKKNGNSLYLTQETSFVMESHQKSKIQSHNCVPIVSFSHSTNISSTSPQFLPLEIWEDLFLTLCHV